MLEDNEAFASYDNKGFESKHSPVKTLCPSESMRNRANAMNFNKKVVTKVICVKGVVFQNRHCLTFFCMDTFLRVIKFFKNFNIHLIGCLSDNFSPVIAYL